MAEKFELPRKSIKNCIGLIRGLTQECNKKQNYTNVIHIKTRISKDIFEVVFFVEQILERCFRLNSIDDLKKIDGHIAQLRELRQLLIDHSKAEFHKKLNKTIEVLNAIVLATDGYSSKEIDERVEYIISSDYEPVPSDHGESDGIDGSLLNDITIHNERTKLTVGAINLISVGLFGGGFSLPLVNLSLAAETAAPARDLVLVSAGSWAFVAIVVHNWARSMLEGLR